MYEHLMVPIDGSELSNHAVTASVALAKKLGARITALVAEAPPPLPQMGSQVSTYTRETSAYMARTEAHAQEALARFKTLADEAGVPFEGHFERTSAVDDAIVSLAERAACDLIVMATHGRGVIGEMLYGSHTKNVITRSKLPMLVLH